MNIYNRISVKSVHLKYEKKKPQMLFKYFYNHTYVAYNYKFLILYIQNIFYSSLLYILTIGIYLSD